MLKCRHCRSGFTLIELLVVISIVALLVAFLLPALGAARSEARRIICGSNMRQMGMGAEFYMNDFARWMPRFDSLFGQWDTSFGAGILPQWGITAGVTNSNYLHEVWNKGIRYCPDLFNEPDYTSGDPPDFAMTYAAPMGDNAYAGGAYMEDRVDGGYIRVVEGPAILAGQVYRHYTNNNAFDPTESHPLFADFLQTSNHGTPYRVAPHNGNTALRRDTPTIDSKGGWTVWKDLSAGWNEWPAQHWPDSHPEFNMTLSRVNYYPRDVACGVSGRDAEMWSATGNVYTRYYFRVRRAVR